MTGSSYLPLVKIIPFMTIRLLVIITVLGIRLQATAQISDNFSDGSLDQNPTWQGDITQFIVNPAMELQLNAAAAGTSILAVQGNISTAATWDLRFRLGFAPSNQNLLRIYLQADESTLTAGNGYFLEIGETGSNDPLRLYRQDAGSKTLLGTGEAGLVANNPDVRVFVTRTFSGGWAVEAAAGTGALTPQIIATDGTHAGSSDRFFGFQCVYTVSNINKFFFDDLTINLGAPDAIPPVLLSANADNENQVTAVFDETLDPATATNPTNYLLDNGIGQPVSAVLLPGNASVQLTLGTPLFTGIFSLQCSNIQDVTGNVSAPQSVNFQFIKTETATEFDILINEIMADPTPTQGLPEFEWLELYNRSNKSLDLSTLRLKDATGPLVALPAYVLEPGAYVAVVSTLNVTALQAGTQGAVIGFAVGPTILNNDGDIITLTDANGQTIDQVPYDIDWHTDAAKRDGGWSLERINPNLPCLGGENWQSCPVAVGGTPGLPNGALSTAADVTAPKLLEVIVESPSSLLITFSEGLDKTTASDPTAFLSNPPLNIATAEPLASNLAQVRLSLSSPMQASVFYGLFTDGSLADCSGNQVATTDTAFFGLAETAARYDVLITEIMNKPAPSVGLPVAEWIELFNASGKIIDLATLRIQDQTGSPVTLPSRLLAPGQYVVLTALANASTLESVAGAQVLGAGFSASLMNDDSDVLLLTNTNGQVIDRVPYESSWHTETGKKDGGWTLERINPALPCLSSENWQSCPSLPGGTPGQRNASFQSTDDTNPPHLLWAFPESATSLTLTFNEGLTESGAADISVYHFNPPVNIQSAALSASPLQVRLTLSGNLQDGVVYQIWADANLSDCAGNAATGLDTVLFGLPQKPEPQDLVINEVMFNPATGQPRYVEFYNASGKVFDWNEFFIADFSNGASVRQIDQNRLALPGQYHVFTSDAPKVREQFANIILRNVMQNDLPTLDDQEGNITLYWSVGGDTVILDALDYSDDWHNALLSVGDRDGVALERIRVESPTNNAGNWTSAASNVTGAPGTPTLPNSQRASTTNSADGLISIDPPRLSPDDDGREDFLDIQYRLPESGYAATITIFDSDGIPMKKLARQELLGTEGSLRWDGDFDNGSKARPGIYIVFVELFSPDGVVNTLKKVCAVVN